jgi:hypothetical protein
MGLGFGLWDIEYFSLENEGTLQLGPLEFLYLITIVEVLLCFFLKEFWVLDNHLKQSLLN